MESKYSLKLQKIFDVQKKIEDVHPFFKRVFPIALVENNQFFIFDADTSSKQYIFIKQVPTPIPIENGVRAAFPLECYENKCVCIVTGEVFDSIDGYITIIHEFVHCQQSEICSLKLKKILSVARKAQERNDYMWEINYSFPYRDPNFCKTYAQGLEAMEKNRHDQVVQYRKQLKHALKQDDFEYMVWQEWKEGFARLLENKARNKLGIKEHHGGRKKPFDRRLFYMGGSVFIDYLARQNAYLLIDIEILFYRMFQIKNT